MFKHIAAACLAGFTLTACVWTGNESLKDETEASVSDQLTEGRTTQAEVREKFGSPMSTSFTSDGNEIWTYHFSKMQADAVNFIPYVGLFGTSTSGNQKQLVVLFDDRDVVSKYAMSDSDISAKTGIFQ